MNMIFIYARRAKLPMYMLINLLHQESLFATLQARLSSENKLKRQQRRKFSNLQAKVFKYWEEFMEGDRTAKQLLRACSFLNGPSWTKEFIMQQLYITVRIYIKYKLIPRKIYIYMLLLYVL